MTRSSMRARHRHVVEHRQVLDHLAQPDAARVRADRHAELGREQQDRDVLVDPGHPGGVDLDVRDRAELEQLFEDRRGSARARRSPPGSARRPRRSRRGRARRPGWSAPRPSTGRTAPAPASTRSRRRRPSAGWRRWRCGCPARTPRGRCRIRRTSSSRLAPTLSLIWRKPCVDRLLAQPAQLLVVVAEPAGRRGVGGVTPGSQVARPRSPGRRRALRRMSSASSGVSASVR